MSDYGLKTTNDFNGPLADLIKITNAYSKGKVNNISSSNYRDVSIGQHYSGTRSGLYFIADTSGASSSTYATKISSITSPLSSYTGFDFTNVWTINEGVSSPTLRNMP